MNNLLVIVDMVNGFVNFGALADPKINKITPNVVNMIEKAKQKGMKIIAFRDCHEQNDIEFESYPPHCIRGSEEVELIPEIKAYQDDMYIIDKPTTNGFNTREFRRIIANYKFDNIVVCGCCTDICVKNFVLSLQNFLSKNQINTNVRIYENAVATFDSQTHNAYEYHTNALREMEQSGVEIIYGKEQVNERNN